MKRQSSIECYFKTKGSTSKNSQRLDCKNMSDKKVKRLNLSLIKPTTLSKSPKINEEHEAVSGAINLCSDDEDVFDIPKLNLSRGSTGSDGTLIYSLSPESPKKTLQNHQTPQKTRKIFRTPQKSPQSSSTPHSSQSTNFKSTPSPQKFYSPTKNRTVVKRSSSKVKRSLSMEMANLAELAEDEIFAKACLGMDDKSE